MDTKKSRKGGRKDGLRLRQKRAAEGKRQATFFLHENHFAFLDEVKVGLGLKTRGEACEVLLDRISELGGIEVVRPE